MSDLPRIPSGWARIRLLPGCAGGGNPHHPAEDGARVLVSNDQWRGDHCVWGNYKGAPWSTAPKPPGGPGIGRYFCPDELEMIAEPS